MLSHGDDPLKPARDAAFLKLGRNVALFQQLEGGLKAYYRLSTVEGASEADVEAFLARRAEHVEGETFGTVRRLVLDDMAGRDDVGAPGEKTVFRTRFSLDAGFIEERRQTWDALGAERNRLVHHLHEDFDLRSPHGIAALDGMLDPQAERIRAELYVLQGVFNAMAESRSAMQAAIDNGQLEAAWQRADLCASELVQTLVSIGTRATGRGGWIGLQAALAQARLTSPGAEKSFRLLRGSMGLQEALVVCGLFEFTEEPTSRGGMRLLFRSAAPS